MIRENAGNGVVYRYRDAEVLVALGTDMENPRKLNAIMEICMGSEMESHIIPESTIIYTPPEFIHYPFKILSVERPFILSRLNMPVNLPSLLSRKWLLRNSEIK